VLACPHAGDRRTGWSRLSEGRADRCAALRRAAGTHRLASVIASAAHRHAAGDHGDRRPQVQQAVHHRHVDDSPQCRTEVMPGEGQPAMMRGDARNKAQHADGQKHRADCQRNSLHRRAEFGHGCSRPGRLKYRHQAASSSESPTVLHVLEANGSAVIPVLWTCKHRLLGLRR